MQMEVDLGVVRWVGRNALAGVPCRPALYWFRLMLGMEIWAMLGAQGPTPTQGL